MLIKVVRSNASIHLIHGRANITGEVNQTALHRIRMKWDQDVIVWLRVCRSMVGLNELQFRRAQSAQAVWQRHTDTVDEHHVLDLERHASAIQVLHCLPMPPLLHTDPLISLIVREALYMHSLLPNRPRLMLHHQLQHAGDSRLRCQPALPRLVRLYEARRLAIIGNGPGHQ